jgi:hypothetical protein
VAKTFRDLTPFFLPSWLSTGEGGAIAESLLTFIDLMAQKAHDGLEARMPRRAGPSALELITADRMILRGRFATDAEHAERLTQWRTGHHSHLARGTAWALLNQIVEYVGGARAYTLDASRNWFVRGATSVYTSDPGGADYDRNVEGFGDDYQPTFIWYGDDPNVNWSRFWVVLCANPELPWVSAAPDYGDAALWGGATGTPGYAIGLAGWTPADTLAVRKLTRSRHPWRPAGTTPEWLIIQLTDWTVDTVQTDGSGFHAKWSRNIAGTQTPTRDPAHRYISLSPHVNNSPEGDATNFPDDTVMAGGGTYAGDPTSFPASTVLPNGSTYAGDPASFPIAVRLVDDGDQI